MLQEAELDCFENLPTPKSRNKMFLDFLFATAATAQPLQRQAVDVADIAVGGRVDDAVLEGDGDGVAVDLVDGLQMALKDAREVF